MSSVRIGVLISGNGTNLQALIDSIESGEINGRICVVISDREDAYGLIRARKHGIEALFINKKDFINNSDFNKKILEELKKRGIQLLVLAGYLRILSPEIIKEYRNRIINIHPALIPSFCGKGYYGERVHKAVLEYGVKVTGATVHFVDEGTDTGPIIFQKSIEVHNNDTVESLQKKVLEVEHTLLVKAVKMFCQGRLKVIDRKVLEV
ncbi:phosphoribosylglycinamide formyltransferase 1 [Proteiniborus sp. DW1]|uniref:phosphoribosylglycinamide formyltransferase n=1 Tax=Proteiniborus sp. DW1 TaxID=1889883 RepID=UPI00092E1AA5|nr:phosphoribosylglycinamide formyltransferase [Proteiniborus sp. DW1]SCG82051.1 phosphoribosylglycinamide formyltransferase 1 [Proteiniborus sp. DW1]